jgi:hypothetical protein
LESVGWRKREHFASKKMIQQISRRDKESNTVILTALPNYIDDILPSFEYILAPKKQSSVSGAGMMRSSAGSSEAEIKDPEELKKHGQKVYEYMHMDVSRVRMLMNWQCAGGLSYVCATHHRAATAFFTCGNKDHEGKGKPEVSLLEFQEAIVSRHDTSKQCAGDVCLDGDFQPNKKAKVEPTEPVKPPKK